MAWNLNVSPGNETYESVRISSGLYMAYAGVARFYHLLAHDTESNELVRALSVGRADGGIHPQWGDGSLSVSGHPAQLTTPSLKTAGVPVELHSSIDTSLAETWELTPIPPQSE